MAILLSAMAWSQVQARGAMAVSVNVCY